MFARHAGVGVGTVYRHFPTKQALLTELVRQTFRLFTERAREAREAGGEPFALIEGLLRRIAETAAGDAGVQYALTSSDAQAARSEAQAEQDELIAVIAELIERARRAGTIRPGIEAIDIAMLICGVVSAMGPRRRVRLAQASRSGDRHAQGALKRGAIRRVGNDRRTLPRAPAKALQVLLGVIAASHDAVATGDVTTLAAQTSQLRRPERR